MTGVTVSWKLLTLVFEPKTSTAGPAGSSPKSWRHQLVPPVLQSVQSALEWEWRAPASPDMLTVSRVLPTLPVIDDLSDKAPSCPGCLRNCHPQYHGRPASVFDRIEELEAWDVGFGESLAQYAGVWVPLNRGVAPLQPGWFGGGFSGQALSPCHRPRSRQKKKRGWSTVPTTHHTNLAWCGLVQVYSHPPCIGNFPTLLTPAPFLSLPPSFPLSFGFHGPPHGPQCHSLYFRLKH